MLKDTDLLTTVTTPSRGIAFGIKKYADIEVINKICDIDGRLTLLNVKMDNVIVSQVCLYAPNYRTDRNSLFKKVNNFIEENTVDITLIAGDFNEALKI